ncbi:MAG TPA: hypothetical protein VE010_22240, partial [Thermoanaerobaculia bacterium]|nr:hypothetical protein [Thermoanaerobaculia bacterium]
IARRRVSTRMAALVRRLALKPYGDELLTRSADFWLFSARLIILTMAVAEGIAWGYMGALMSRAYPLLAASVAALFVFTLVWIIDATFITLDLSRGFYEQLLLGKKENPVKEKVKLFGGIAARVAIVSASLFITAPFLAQAIFAADVEDEMARRNSGAVASKRGEIEQPFVARGGELLREQKLLEQQRVQEAAGVGPSGKYGRGPALDTIERQLAEKKSELAAVEQARASALAQFDGLSRPELEQHYGLRFLAPGVQASGALLGDLMKNPQFTGAELAVRAFLAFLFIGLLILKVFQPRSIAVYFNEQLHSIHDEYRKGLFDSYLPEPERAANGGTMEPLRFEDWCLNTSSLIRKEDERRRETAREYRMHELLVEQWQRLGAAAREELGPLVQRHEATLAAIDEVESELHRATTAATTAETELQQVESAHKSMQQQIERGGMDGPTFAQAMKASSELEERRRALSAALREQARTIETCTKRLELRRGEEASLRNEIASKERVIGEADSAIGGERMKLSETIARRREAWAGNGL